MQIASAGLIATEARSIAEPSQRIGWTTVCILFIFYIFAMVDRQIMTMLVDPIRKDLGIDDVQASMLLGLSFAIFYTTIGLAMGWLVDRYSRRTIIAASVALWGLASAACGLSQNFTELFIARMLVGVGEAALGPAAFSMLADAFPKRRLALALSVYTTGALVGGAIAMLASGFVIHLSAEQGHISLPYFGDVSSWRLVFFVTGLPGPIVALLAFLVPEPRRTGNLSATLKPAAHGLVGFVLERWRLFVYLCLGFGAMNMILSSVFAWSPTYMLRSLGVMPITVGILIAIKLLLAALPGQVFNGWYIDRLAARGESDIYLRYFMISVPLGVPFGIWALLSSDTTMFVLGMLPLYFVCMSFMGIASSALQLITPNEFRGRISALFIMTTTMIGLGGGPTLVAVISSAIDPRGRALGEAMAIVVAGAALVAIVSLAMGRPHFRRALALVPGQWDAVPR